VIGTRADHSGVISRTRQAGPASFPTRNEMGGAVGNRLNENKAALLDPEPHPVE